MPKQSKPKARAQRWVCGFVLEHGIGAWLYKLLDGSGSDVEEVWFRLWVMFGEHLCMYAGDCWAKKRVDKTDRQAAKAIPIGICIVITMPSLWLHSCGVATATSVTLVMADLVIACQLECSHIHRQVASLRRWTNRRARLRNNWQNCAIKVCVCGSIPIDYKNNEITSVSSQEYFYDPPIAFR